MPTSGSQLMLMRDHAGEVPFPFTRDVSIDVADQVRSDQVSRNLLDASTAHQITQPAILLPRCAARGCVPSSSVALRVPPNGAACFARLRVDGACPARYGACMPLRSVRPLPTGSIPPCLPTAGASIPAAVSGCTRSNTTARFTAVVVSRLPPAFIGNGNGLHCLALFCFLSLSIPSLRAFGLT
jgi:hypothetical protein